VIGWRSQIGETWEPNTGVFGVVVAKSYNDPTSIRKYLEAGIEKVPHAVWVMRDQNVEGHAARFAYQTFKAHGIQPFQVPLVDYWQGKGVPLEGPLPERKRKRETLFEYDLRSDWRDITLRSTCERVIVFHDAGSGITGDWVSYRDSPLSQARIMVAERGKARSKHRKGRKPD